MFQFGSSLSTVVRFEPLAGLNLSLQLDVDMRRYELLIGIANLLVLDFTAGRALAREQAFAHEIPEQITVSPIGNAQHIVEALVGDTVSGREFALIEGAARCQGRPEMRGARDGTACHVLSELQQNE